MDWQAAAVSVRVAALTAAVLLVLGLPLAHWLACTRWRGRPIVEAVVALPLVLPPTVLGFYLLYGLGPRTSLGRLLEAWCGQTFVFSMAGIVIGSVIYNLPFAVGPFRTAFASIDPGLLEASQTLGRSRLGTFARISLPLAWPGILTGLAVSFAHAMGEFGVVLLIGGNIPGATRTLSIAIYDSVQALDYAAAAQSSILLALLALSALSLVYGLQRRVLSV